MKALIYALLLCLAEAAHAGCRPEQSSTAKLRQSDLILSQPLEASDVERKQLVEVSVNGVKKRLPFGYINDQWIELLRQRQEGDMIVFFETAPEKRGPLYGVTGYALLRNGCVVTSILTSIS